MDQIIQQALSRGVGNYVNEALERASAGASRRAVESHQQLLDFVRLVPDEVWHLLTAGVEGAAQVLLARVTNPLLRSILSAVLATLPGLGRGLADAEARRVVVNGLQANISGPAVQLPGHVPPMARFFHSSRLPGLAHRATYDAAGNPTGTTCQLVGHDRRAHRIEHPDRQQGGGRGQPQQNVPGAPYPESFPTLDEAGQMRLGLCGACFEGGSLATTAAAPATTLFGKLNPEQRVRLLRVHMWIRRTEDATDDSIVSDLASADIEAVRTALGEGFGADNSPTETSVEALLAAAGRRPSAASRLENMLRRAVRAIDRRDFSGAWAAINSLGLVGLIGVFLLCLWGASVLASIATFFGGWVTGHSWSWFYGGIWTFVCFLFVPLVQKPLVWIGDEVRKLRGNAEPMNESFALIGLDVSAFCLIMGAVGAWGIEMGFGPGWRGALAMMNALLIGAMFIHRRNAKDLSWSRYGVVTVAHRQKAADAIFRAGYRRAVLVATAAVIAPIAYLTVGRSIDIPWVTLTAVEYNPGVEVQTSHGAVQTTLPLVTPNAFGLRTRHETDEVFGTGALDSKMVRLRKDGTVESDALVPDLPGFILRNNWEGDTLTFSWKPGLTAQTFRAMGSDWYARHCYPEAEANGTATSASSAGGAQGNSGEAASANQPATSERTYLGLTAGWAAGLLVGLGVVIMLVAGFVRGQSAGAGAVRGVGTVAFLLLVAAAIGIVGYDGVQSLRDDWKEAHAPSSETRVTETKPAAEPSVEVRNTSTRRDSGRNTVRPSAPKAKRTVDCSTLSPRGREICLEEQRKATAGR